MSEREAREHHGAEGIKHSESGVQVHLANSLRQDASQPVFFEEFRGFWPVFAILPIEPAID
jgi:hypothetical protein